MTQKWALLSLYQVIHPCWCYLFSGIWPRLKHLRPTDAVYKLPLVHTVGLTHLRWARSSGSIALNHLRVCGWSEALMVMCGGRLSCTATLLALTHLFCKPFNRKSGIQVTGYLHRWYYEGICLTILLESSASWTAWWLAVDPAAWCVCHQFLPWQLLGLLVSAGLIWWWNRDHRETFFCQSLRKLATNREEWFYTRKRTQPQFNVFRDQDKYW